jgi:hypothetical protein
VPSTQNLECSSPQPYTSSSRWHYRWQ